MFEPNASWSLPAHLFLVSEWSADCTQEDNPASCVNGTAAILREAAAARRLRRRGRPKSSRTTRIRHQPIYAWTDLTYLLHKDHVSWGYYVVSGTEPDCENDAADDLRAGRAELPTRPGSGTRCRTSTPSRPTASSATSSRSTTSTPRPRAGTLPAVSWVVPSGEVSEHPPAPVSYGQSYVTSLVNAVMRSPDWDSTAIFLAWDDWGGFYDHVVPPVGRRRTATACASRAS